MSCYDMLAYVVLCYFDKVVDVMVWYVTCVTGVLTYVMLWYVNICCVMLLALYNITWYVMTCNMIVETHYGDTHFHREQTHDSKWKIVVLCFSFLKIFFMDTLTLDSEFCKVQNKVSIWKFCDSSVYIALGGPDNIIFLILLRLAGNRV